MLFDLLRAIFELGIPVAALSWLLFYRLYSRGDIARDADSKTIDAGLKEIKKAAKKSKERSDSVVYTKWMKFGGGFYGVAALWTLLMIEASGIAGMVAHPSAIETMFHNGPVDVIVNQVTGQINNFIQALLWFRWWPEKGHGPWFWFVVAYAGYLAGLNLARRETRFGSQIVAFDSRERWLSLMPVRKRAGDKKEEDKKEEDA